MRHFILSLALLVTSVGSANAQLLFADVTESANLVKPLAGLMGHGGAWGDYNGDGRIDIYLGGFCDRPDEEYKPADGPVGNRLLRNLGDGKFERVRQPAVEFHGRTSGAVFADLDNDGDLELYCANNCKGNTRKTEEPQRSAQLRHSNLFRNDGGKFVDISAECGACPDELNTARNIGVFDYDGDGLLDVLVIEDRFTKNPRSILFRNLGGLKFKDVTKEVGLPDDLFGLGCAVADLNEDGRPDFFVGHSNRMFLSTKAGKYREPESLRKLFAWTPKDNEDWPCGAAFGDLNRDGKLDMVLSIHHENARNRIYLNDGLKDGVPQFRDVSKQVGMPAELPEKSPHVEIQDFDNDGWPDLYFSTAWLDANGKVTPLVFRNLGANDGLPKFEPNREVKGPMVYYPAGPSGDYDGDGYIDLLLINWFQGNHTRLMKNLSAKNNWVNLTVTGRTFNRMGIGTQVKVYAPGQLGKPEALVGFQEITTGYGYASGQPAVAHFGVGKLDHVDVEMRLPNGKVMSFKTLPVNKNHAFVESTTP